MIIYLLKGSFRYCFANRKSMVTVIILATLLNLSVFAVYFQMVFHQSLAGITESAWCVFITLLLTVGYGLVVTRDLIEGGSELPKIVTWDTLKFGFKGLPVLAVYSAIQVFLMGLIAVWFGFPVFDLEEMLLNIADTSKLLFTHDPISTVLFFAISFVLFFITVFFMEVALAQLADSGRFRDAFNIYLSFKNIGRIGWIGYAVDVVYVALAVVILSFISDLLDPYPLLNFIGAVAVSVLIFVIQFGAIGIAFRDIKDN